MKTMRAVFVCASESKPVLIVVIALTVLCTVSPREGPGHGVQAQESSHVEAHTLAASAISGHGGSLIHPGDFVYRGAFRLPDDAARPRTFAYGGAAMTFNPAGNPEGSSGNPGSLFIMGHNRMPYGELPDGNQVAEISIPMPVISRSIGALNQAEFLQAFHNVAAGFFTTLVEIPRAGMEYLDTPATGPLIHLAFGQHLQDSAQTAVASHAWFSPNLRTPNMRGPWYIGNRSIYSVNEYVFEIPAAWAAQHVGGRRLATGRFKDGGWSGMGPSLFAYQPWVDSSGTPAAPNTRLAEVALLQYESSRNTANIVRCMDGYQHPDEWGGGAWLTAAGGKSAVLFAGTKSVGSRYWYGFINPAGPDYACVEEAFLGQFTLCRLADGRPCPDEYSATCSGHTSNRGWWTSRFNARFILYNPADLAAVAAGTWAPHQPQPYAYLDIDERLFLNPAGIETDMLGTGPQRRYRIGDVAYDRENGYLYVLELYTDEAKPVVHVWQVEPAEDTDPLPSDRSPSGGEIVEQRHPVFRWPAISGATWYQLWINRNGQTYQLPWIRGATSWTPPASGLPGGLYRWWVRAWGPSIGYRPWSTAADFSIPVRLPAAVSLIAPTGAQESHDLTFRWTQDAHATWYRLWVDHPLGGTWHDDWYVRPGPDEASVDVRGHPGGESTWWLRPWGPDGYGPWSGPAVFSTPDQNPSAPVLLNPMGMQAAARPVFEWEEAARTEWYRVFVQQGDTVFVDEWTRDRSWILSSDLLPGAYTWWVGSWNGITRRTVWSSSASFAIP